MCIPGDDRRSPATKAKKLREELQPSSVLGVSERETSADTTIAPTKPTKQYSSSSFSSSSVLVSPRSLILILAICSGMSFGAGRLARDYYLVRPDGPTMSGSKVTVGTEGPTTTRSNEVKDKKLPEIPGDRKAPHNRYTFQQFEAPTAVRSHSILLETECEADGTCHREDGAAPQTVIATEGHEHTNSSSTEHSTSYEPAGQHLLVDIENVDAYFLNDEERLATAMIELVKESSLTMLSYHCHGLEPMGVSCVGVLLESHVSFHTWPSEGVIVLDLFTCGPQGLLPLLSTIKELFSIPRYWNLLPRMLWGHKRRGFRAPEKSNLEDNDFHLLLGSMDYGDKTHVTTVATNFQTIDIYDVVVANRFDKIKDRMVFLDSILQSRKFGEAAYHEALVHPAMFTHDGPKCVVIIGGGEGATLREVLKHKTVEEVILMEIDEQMVHISRQYLPDWSDCSNLAGSADSCFDDPRVVINFEDAKAWFISRFGGKQRNKHGRRSG